MSFELIVAKAEEQFFPWVMESLTVENDEQFKNISDVLGVGKKIASNLEDERKIEKKPFVDSAKLVDEKYAQIQKRVAFGVNLLTEALLKYQRKKKKEADDLLMLQAQEEAKKIADSRETGEVYEAPAPIVRPVSQTVRGNMSTATVIESWNYQITDPDAVPRDLCSPDMAKIKARHKSGIKEIPGVLITKTERVMSRLG